MNDKDENIEYEKMIIDIPKDTRAVSVVSIFSNNFKLTMNTHTYDTEDVIKRRLERADILETGNYADNDTMLPAAE